MMANEVRSSHWWPKVIVPRQTSDTFSPVRPTLRVFISLSPCLATTLAACAPSRGKRSCSPRPRTRGRGEKNGATEAPAPPHPSPGHLIPLTPPQRCRRLVPSSGTAFARQGATRMKRLLCLGAVALLCAAAGRLSAGGEKG